MFAADDCTSENTDITAADLLGHRHPVEACLDRFLADLLDDVAILGDLPMVVIHDMFLVVRTEELVVLVLERRDFLIDEVFEPFVICTASDGSLKSIPYLI